VYWKPHSWGCIGFTETAILTQGTPAQQYAVLVHSFGPFAYFLPVLLIAVIRSLTYRLLNRAHRRFGVMLSDGSVVYGGPVAAVALEKQTWVL